MARAATARPMPQLFDSVLTLQQQIWEQSFRMLSAFARPATLPMDPASAAEAAGLVKAVSEAPAARVQQSARSARSHSRPTARANPSKSRSSGSRKDRPTASAGKRGNRGGNKRS